MGKLEKLLNKIHILIVDDMESIRNLVKSCLYELGAKNISMAADGEHAWKHLNSARFDLVICDIDMPKLDGIELLKRIRFSDSHAKIPVIMLTAAVDKDNVNACIKVGANDYVAKPFQPKTLIFRVIKQLNKMT
ncbi:response regulator [Alteromonas sp. ASW11-36]|uniref:Response regulator n=1 Tax=Alteromonas arenosi TaxID=3055817 RepID=A0ABT7STH5_9ALTE|nr:response regulator [Alteromonas sp. ASW11-36]MDM7859461.1 response regulator [Alteromonas sp. ASW11-36]